MTPSSPSSEQHHFTYDGTLSKLYGIWLLNLFLGILTLGIYHFWGKTRMRRYLASHVSLAQERFEYTGTGWELCRGFLMVLPILILLSVVLSEVPLQLASSQTALTSFQTFWLESLNIIGSFVFYFLLRAGTYTSFRYRLSRLRFRAIAGKQAGSAWQYATLSLKHMFLLIFTLGLSKPIKDRAMLRYRFNHTWFGTAQGSFTSREFGALYRRYLLCYLLFFPTLTLSRYWYKAALYHYSWGNFEIASLRFHAHYTGKDLCFLSLTNILIFFFTLGLGTPFILKRWMHYWTRHLAVSGDLASLNVSPNKDTMRAGEGLASWFDIDVSLV